jgi:hypothetical protein
MNSVSSESSFTETSIPNSDIADSNISGSTDKLLTIEQATQLAGVSASTLMRFAEAGYFRIHNSGPNIKFSGLEIAQVFGTSLKDSSTRIAPSSLKEEKTINPSDASIALEAKKDQTADEISATNNNRDELNLQADQTPLSQKIEVIIEADGPKSLSPQTAEIASAFALNSTTTSTTESFEPFKKVLQLQEELLAQKTNLIEDLIKERDWLRTRLEKMEEKAERDQMLLMVESQKVRCLIGKDKTSEALPQGIFSRAISFFAR